MHVAPLFDPDDTEPLSEVPSTVERKKPPASWDQAPFMGRFPEQPEEIPERASGQVGAFRSDPQEYGGT